MSEDFANASDESRDGFAEWRHKVHEAVARRSVKTMPVGETRVKQAFRDASDANLIMKKYLSTGEVPEYRQGVYGDFSNAVDYHTAVNMVMDAEEKFMQLPSEIRQHCKNDPGELLDIVMNPERRAEAEGLGLLPKAVEQAEQVAAPAESPEAPPEAPTASETPPSTAT